MSLLIMLLLFGFAGQYAAEEELQENAKGEVMFVNVLFRHGDRNIIRTFANDPNKDISNWPDGFGQLTNVGKRQEFALGQWLRQRYDGLLTDRYSRDLVYVRSTDVDRTLMSAKCVLAGMFPPKGAQVWNDKLNWQPIPTHTVPEELDKVIAQKYPCPAYNRELQKVLSSPEITNLTAKYSDLIKFLRDNTGENITTLDDVKWIYYDLLIEELKNLTVPDWSSGLFPSMYEATSYCFALPTWNTKLARLKSGLLVKEIINNLEAKREQKTSLNVNVYAVHETTIVSLFNTLGVYDLHIPPYAATVMMELRVDPGGSHQVTLYYRNSTTDDPFLLTVPGCAEVCPLDQLINLTRPVIPEDWDRECHSDQ